MSEICLQKVIIWTNYHVELFLKFRCFQNKFCGTCCPHHKISILDNLRG